MKLVAREACVVYEVLVVDRRCPQIDPDLTIKSKSFIRIVLHCALTSQPTAPNTRLLDPIFNKIFELHSRCDVDVFLVPFGYDRILNIIDEDGFILEFAEFGHSDVHLLRFAVVVQHEVFNEEHHVVDILVAIRSWFRLSRASLKTADALFA